MMMKTYSESSSSSSSVLLYIVRCQAGMMTLPSQSRSDSWLNFMRKILTMQFRLRRSGDRSSLPNEPQWCAISVSIRLSSKSFTNSNPLPRLIRGPVNLRPTGSRINHLMSIQTADVGKVMQACDRIGRLCARTGRLQDAASFVEAALEGLRDAKDGWEMAQCVQYHKLAQIYAQLGRPRAADQADKKSKAISRRDTSALFLVELD